MKKDKKLGTIEYFLPYHIYPTLQNPLNPLGTVVHSAAAPVDSSPAFFRHHPPPAAAPPPSEPE